MNGLITIPVEKFEELVRDSQTLEAIRTLAFEGEYISDKTLRSVIISRKGVKMHESV